MGILRIINKPTQCCAVNNISYTTSQRITQLSSRLLIVVIAGNVGEAITDMRVEKTVCECAWHGDRDNTPRLRNKNLVHVGSLACLYIDLHYLLYISQNHPWNWRCDEPKLYYSTWNSEVQLPPVNNRLNLILLIKVYSCCNFSYK